MLKLKEKDELVPRFVLGLRKKNLCIQFPLTFLQKYLVYTRQESDINNLKIAIKTFGYKASTKN